MMRQPQSNQIARWITLLSLFLSVVWTVSAFASDSASAPAMPSNWQVISDFQAPAEQVEQIGAKLGAQLSAVRNTLYAVDGKRVQINVLVTPDAQNTEKLMASLRSMKSEESLLRKGLVVYEFVGQNDVLPLIAQGRKHLATQ